MRISDCRSDVFSSDLLAPRPDGSCLRLAADAGRPALPWRCGFPRPDVRLRPWPERRWRRLPAWLRPDGAGRTRDGLRPLHARSDEGREGNKRVSTCRSRWEPEREKKKKNIKTR